CRGPDVEANVQIASSTAADVGKSLSPQRYDSPGLGSGPHLDRGRAAIRGWNSELASEGRLAERDGEIVDHVVAIPLEAGILLDLDGDDQVSGRPAPEPDGTLPPESQVVIRGNSGWHLDIQGLFAPHPSFTTALWARLPGHRALAAAVRARCH